MAVKWWKAHNVQRPYLAISELPLDAWSELCRRQDRLPLKHLHRKSDWYAININEQRAVHRWAGRLRLDDHEEYSLFHHHMCEVHRRAAIANPEVVMNPPLRAGVRRASSGTGSSGMIATRPRRRHLIPRGWGCWLGNRRVGVRAKWLRFTVQH